MAVRRTQKAKHSKKHSTKKHSTTKHESHSGSSAMNYCVGCRGKTMIHNLQEEDDTQHGTTRKRMVGKCDKGHKFFRFMKA